MMTTPIDRESVERLAKKFCAQESEIWEEAGLQNRRRWRREARAALLGATPLNERSEEENPDG